MSEANEEEDKQERRFSQEQYDMLKRCSEKKDMTEWNEWRYENRGIEILLGGAHFRGAYLEGVNLFRVNLKGASLYEANLKNADLRLADLENADLFAANLEDAKLAHANLKVRSLSNGNLQRAEVWSADLENACLSGCDLKNANFSYAVLKGACFDDSELLGASFQQAVVGGSTSFWECYVDRHTDFRGVALDSASIDPGTKQLLEYNIRRKNWGEWYAKQHRLLAWIVREFWQISDYGTSTKQIIKTFLQWALIFAAVYLAWGLIDYHFVGLKDAPGIVSNLFVLEGKQETVSPWLVPFRAFYFSIVTMTTLGFGDMYASAHSFLRGLFGHALLALQVILGYVLLGALVTRFAVLFTAGGPAGKFAEEKKETPQ